MKKILLLFTVAIGCLQAQDYKKETFVRFSEERIGQELFTHRVDIIDGATRERWSVNGASVGHDEYEQRLESALLARIRASRAKELEHRRAYEQELEQQQQFLRSCRVATSKKRLRQLVAETESELVKVRDGRLQAYLQFDDSTYPSRQLFDQTVQAVGDAKQQLAVCEPELTEPEFEKMAADLEGHPARMRGLFRSTVKHAIDTCDDTRVLKELLELVS